MEVLRICILSAGFSTNISWLQKDDKKKKWLSTEKKRPEFISMFKIFNFLDDKNQDLISILSN